MLWRVEGRVAGPMAGRPCLSRWGERQNVDRRAVGRLLPSADRVAINIVCCTDNWGLTLDNADAHVTVGVQRFAFFETFDLEHGRQCRDLEIERACADVSLVIGGGK